MGVSTGGSIIVGSGVLDVPFFWDNGTIQWVHVGNFDDVEAFDVSDDGNVIVGTADGEAYRYEDNTLEILGDFDGGNLQSEGRAVSADGSVVVGQGTVAAGKLAFRWTDATGMVSLGDLQGGSLFSDALDVSPDGSTVVGWSEGTEGVQAFRWTESTDVLTPLGSLGKFPSKANGVSEDGTVIVGVSATPTGAEHAFVWDDTQGIRDLNNVLVSLGLDLTGWTLIEATAVSDDGMTIVGVGDNPSGRLEAWIAFIPELSPLV